MGRPFRWVNEFNGCDKWEYEWWSMHLGQVINGGYEVEQIRSGGCNLVVLRDITWVVSGGKYGVELGKIEEYLAWDLGLIERLCKGGHAGVGWKSEVLGTESAGTEQWCLWSTSFELFPFMFNLETSIFLLVECFSESVHINVHSLNHVTRCMFSSSWLSSSVFLLVISFIKFT